MRLDLAEDQIEAVQDGLAALRGLYDLEANYGRADLRPEMMQKLLAVEEIARRIHRQTGIGLPANPTAAPVAAPY